VPTNAEQKQFARDLDNNKNVKLFIKLPSWFRISGFALVSTRHGWDHGQREG